MLVHVCFRDRDKEIPAGAHLFFYLADEDGNALSVSNDILDTSQIYRLAYGSRYDVGGWQLRMQSMVCFTK